MQSTENRDEENSQAPLPLLVKLRLLLGPHKPEKWHKVDETPGDSVEDDG